MVPGCLRADVVTLPPVADTTLVETTPTNSLGAVEFFNAGTTQNYTRNRGLVRFEVAGNVPAGSRILGARVQIEVTRRPRDGFDTAFFGLHRMKVSWGEGAASLQFPDTSPGLGGPALPGDATWTHRFWGTELTWAEPGGKEAVDYEAKPGSDAIIYGLEDSPYVFESRPALVKDVQLWLDSPADNFGWMIRPSNEGSNFTARRIGSRESSSPPLLLIEYTPPAATPELGIVRSDSGGFTVSFQAEAGVAYRLEESDATLEGRWTTVQSYPATPGGSSRSFHVAPQNAGRFYRLATP